MNQVSLIVTTEPLFAAIAAVCCLGETFSLGDYLGPGLSAADHRRGAPGGSLSQAVRSSWPRWSATSRGAQGSVPSAVPSAAAAAEALGRRPRSDRSEAGNAQQRLIVVHVLPQQMPEAQWAQQMGYPCLAFNVQVSLRELNEFKTRAKNNHKHGYERTGRIEI